jgi:hypothetical protein
VQNNFHKQSFNLSTHANIQHRGQSQLLNLHPQPLQAQAKPLLFLPQALKVVLKVQAQPLEVQAQPLMVQAQPLQLQAQPLKAHAIKVQSQPLEVQAQPLELQASKLQVQAQPLKLHADRLTTKRLQKRLLPVRNAKSAWLQASAPKVAKSVWDIGSTNFDRSQPEKAKTNRCQLFRQRSRTRVVSWLYCRMCPARE